MLFIYLAIFLSINCVCTILGITFLIVRQRKNTHPVSKKPLLNEDNFQRSEITTNTSINVESREDFYEDPRFSISTPTDTCSEETESLDQSHIVEWMLNKKEDEFLSKPIAKCSPKTPVFTTVERDLDPPASRETCDSVELDPDECSIILGNSVVVEHSEIHNEEGDDLETKSIKFMNTSPVISTTPDRQKSTPTFLRKICNEGDQHGT